MSDNKKYILTAVVAEKKLRRMALEIAERNYNEPQLILIGIKEQGSVIAKKISGYLKINFKGEVIVIELGIDKKKPAAVILSTPMYFNDKQ